MRFTEYKEKFAILIGLGIVYAALVVLFSFLESEYVTASSSKAFYHWITLATGIDWSSHDKFSALGFALASAFRIMLTVGSMLGVMWLVITLMLRKGDVMKVTTVVNLRDERIIGIIKQNLQKYVEPSQLEAYESKIDSELHQIFDDSTKGLKKELEDVLDEKQAKEIIESICEPG